jgi:hypothetical protein
VVLEQRSARPVVSIVCIGGGDQRPGIDQQHSVAPEALGQHVVGVGAPTRGARGADGDERQLSTSTTGTMLCGEAGGECFGGQLVDGHAAAGRFGGKTID